MACKVILIDEWKQFWKMYSTHALSIAGAIPVAWASMPSDWQESCKWMLLYLAPAVALSGIIGRVVKQQAVSGAGIGNPTPGEDSSPQEQQ
jgi:hypothetical protein